MQKRRALVIACLVGVLFIATASAWLTLSPHAEKASAPFGGAFELTDQDGRRVTERDLLGKPSVIFFGFTYCPDVCPGTLLEMTNWLRALGADADKLNVVFVSVDYERDTPQQIKAYLSSFDPHIRGFTGNEHQIRRIAAGYRVYYRRVALNGGDHTYDHSATIYLVDKDGQYIERLTYKEPDAVAVSKIRELIGGKHS